MNPKDFLSLNIDIKKLYAITPNTWNQKHFLTLETWLANGLGMVQYRAKNKSFEAMLDDVFPIKQLCEQYEAKLIINDHVQLASHVNADGIHLGQNDLSNTSIQKIRDEMGPEKMLGVTCHSSISLCEKAVEQGADYVSLGACFTSQTKSNAKPLDWSVLKDAKRLSLPICLIGGVTAQNIHKLQSYSPKWIAASKMFF